MHLMLYLACFSLVERVICKPVDGLESSVYSRCTTSPTATIDSGMIIGTTTSLPDAETAVNEFLGIPYAKSPPGRFEKPQPPEPFETPLEVKKWSNACMQQFFYPQSFRDFLAGVYQPDAPPESEDCLYLNVYAPAAPPRPHGRTVMVWIYGGAFQIGTAGLSLYDLSAFAAYQDIVAVSFNYRLNVFGFPSSPDLPSDVNNVGLLDQRLALDWVQRNIEAFGGDPKKVTIFGQSAGGWSVDLLTVTYPENPPFRAAILESGQLTWNVPTIDTLSTSWPSLMQSLNCTGKRALECVRAAPAATIKSIIEHQELIFWPTRDESTYPADIVQRRLSDHFAKIPVMSGYTQDEKRILALGYNNLTEYIQNRFGNLGPKATRTLPAIEAAFPVGNISGVNTVFDRVGQIQSLTEHQCGASFWANATAANDAPVFQYLYNASFPNVAIMNDLFKVYHGTEIYSVFQTYPGGPVNPVTAEPMGLVPSNKPPTAQQVALSRFMNAAWAQFAKEPAYGPGWSKLGSFNGRDMAILGANEDSGVTMVEFTNTDEQCQLLRPLFEAVAG